MLHQWLDYEFMIYILAKSLMESAHKTSIGRWINEQISGEEKVLRN